MFFESNWTNDAQASFAKLVEASSSLFDPELTSFLGSEGAVTRWVLWSSDHPDRAAFRAYKENLRKKCAQYLADVTPLPRTIIVDGSYFKQILSVGGQVVQLQILLHYILNLPTELCPHIVRRGSNKFIKLHLKRVHIFCWACPINLWSNEHMGVVLIYSILLSFP